MQQYNVSGYTKDEEVPMEQAKQTLNNLEVNVNENSNEEQTMFEWLSENGQTPPDI